MEILKRHLIMLKEAISVSVNIFLPLFQELIQLVFLSLYIKGDIFTWLSFSEYLLKGNKEKPLFVCSFPWTMCLLHKKYKASYELLLGCVAHVLSLLFPVTCLSAKTTISLIDFRKGKVLILKWDILKERLKCKKKTRRQSKTKI